ncbi:unnamed protein product, partial [Polarella glacialis]
AAAEAAAATEALLRGEPSSFDAEDASGALSGGPHGRDVDEIRRRGQDGQLATGMDSELLGPPELPPRLSSTQSEDLLDEIQDEASAASSRVEMLLSMPFKEALEECEELRRFVRNPARPEADTKELEAEFLENWSPEAPKELRDVLEELLDPEVADSAAEDQARFKQEMSATMSRL